MMLEIDPGSTSEPPFFQDVLDLCLYTDVCNKLGLSFNDFMMMDLATFTKIQKAVNKENDRKTKFLEEENRKQQQRQNEILGKK